MLLLANFKRKKLCEWRKSQIVFAFEPELNWTWTVLNHCFFCCLAMTRSHRRLDTEAKHRIMNLHRLNWAALDLFTLCSRNSQGNLSKQVLRCVAWSTNRVIDSMHFTSSMIHTRNTFSPSRGWFLLSVDCEKSNFANWFSIADS